MSRKDFEIARSLCDAYWDICQISVTGANERAGIAWIITFSFMLAGVINHTAAWVSFCGLVFMLIVMVRIRHRHHCDAIHAIERQIERLEDVNE